MAKPFVIIGCGGHSRVVASALKSLDRCIVAYTALDPCTVDRSGLCAQVYTDDEVCTRFSPEDVDLVLGVGLITSSKADSQICRLVETFKSKGYQFEGFRHPFSWVASEARVARTAQIHMGAVVQPGATVDEFSIINTKASVDHDCMIGKFCHVGPGATICGTVQIEDGCYVGAGSTIIQGLRVCKGGFVGAGACVVAEVAEHAYVRGVPAKPFTPTKLKME